MSTRYFCATAMAEWITPSNSARSSWPVTARASSSSSPSRIDTWETIICVACVSRSRFW